MRVTVGTRVKVLCAAVALSATCSLDFSDHFAIISSPITGQYILNALDPALARKPICTLVPPAV